MTARRRSAAPAGAYRVIAGDPPWAPRDKLPGRTRGAARQYSVLPTPKICSFLETHQIAVADDAILFLWRLASMQQEALDVAAAWGFRVSSEIVWRKLTARGLPHFGMGRSVRAGHETCLVCVRGRVSRLVVSHNVRSVFDAPLPVGTDGKRIHSAKPPEFFELVEKLVGSGGPRLELFARQRRPGWDAVGDQLPATAARAA